MQQPTLSLVSFHTPAKINDADGTTLCGLVKGQPVASELQFTGEYDHYLFDFFRFKVSCILLYDREEEEEEGQEYREVAQSDNQVEWNTCVSENGEKVGVDVRVFALTSQHGDKHFRIKFIALPPRGLAATISLLCCQNYISIRPTE